jgi:hypothetical protein
MVYIPEEESRQLSKRNPVMLKWRVTECSTAKKFCYLNAILPRTQILKFWTNKDQTVQDLKKKYSYRTWKMVFRGGLSVRVSNILLHKYYIMRLVYESVAD